MQIVDGIKVWADIESEVTIQSIKQFKEFLEGQDNIVSAALMSDCHFGFSVPIGAVFASKDVIYPAAVGYDIGCGVIAVPTSFDVNDVRTNAKKIFDNIYRDIPVGFNHNNVDVEWNEWELIPMTSVLSEIFQKNGLKSLATLGAGNHFQEIGVDATDKVWIIIHSGSRNVGHACATHYMKLAANSDKPLEGHFGFDVNSQNGRDFVIDLNFCLEFALKNRLEMASRIVKVMQRHCGDGNADWSKLINRNHNHAELKDGLWIHRKGACSAEIGEMNAIPGNMRDGVFITEGLGSVESLFSSSHGAGRIIGRKEAQRTLDMNVFASSMIGITSKVCQDTLDESPAAYKNIFDVMELQKTLVKIHKHVKPIINIKAG